MNKPLTIGSVFFTDNVKFGENVSLWHGASVRADESEIEIGDGSNVQESATIHGDIGLPVKIGKNVTIGHNAIVHSATICDNVIVGMGAIILNGAKVGSGSIIGAGALITQGKEIPENSVVVGNPYKILKETTPLQREHILLNASEYVRLAQSYVAKSKKD